jgi:hypothetical protein
METSLNPGMTTCELGESKTLNPLFLPLNLLKIFFKKFTQLLQIKCRDVQLISKPGQFFKAVIYPFEKKGRYDYIIIRHG